MSDSSDSASAFASFLLGLRRVNIPILRMVEFNLVADMVLHSKARTRGPASWCRRPENRPAQMCPAPDIRKTSASALGHPQAWILSVPTLVQMRIGRMRVVIGICPAPMPAQQSQIVRLRVGAGFPKHRDRARIDSAGKHAEAADNIGSARRRRNQSHRRAHSLIRSRIIRQIELCQ